MSSSAESLAPGATRDLARFAAGLSFAGLPQAVVDRIRLCILDAVACAAFGATLPWTAKVRTMAEAEEAAPVATLIGRGGRTSAALAALVNGTAGHAFELDDIHRAAIIHPGSLAFPAALALAEVQGGIDGKRFMTALVAGYEVGARAGSAATQALFFRGFHPQGTNGVFASAGAAARILDLDADATQHTLGIAGSQAAGLMAAQEGAMAKRLHSGRAAQAGVYAALLARDGFTGIADVLEAGYGGFLSSFSGKPEPEALTRGLGTEWETLAVGFKPHAAVTSIHAALDALAALMREHGLSADDIAAVDVGIGPMTYTHCAWPYKAQSVTAAQMNLFYGLAVMALDGAAFVAQYREDRLADPAILDFIGRIAARVDAEIDAMGPAFRHAVAMTVTTRDGRRVSARLLHRRGSPEHPLSRDDVVAKFRALAGEAYPPAQLARIERMVDGLEGLADMREFAQALAG
ncbi:MAG: MmgE/PrpD family protein [Alphaproteobacteria bacterium]